MDVQIEVASSPGDQHRNTLDNRGQVEVSHPQPIFSHINATNTSSPRHCPDVNVVVIQPPAPSEGEAERVSQEAGVVHQVRRPRLRCARGCTSCRRWLGNGLVALTVAVPPAHQRRACQRRASLHCNRRRAPQGSRRGHRGLVHRRGRGPPRPLVERIIPEARSPNQTKRRKRQDLLGRLHVQRREVRLRRRQRPKHSRPGASSVEPEAILAFLDRRCRRIRQRGSKPNEQTQLRRRRWQLSRRWREGWPPPIAALVHGCRRHARCNRRWAALCARLAAWKGKGVP
mmetsp:Transcript_84244/g.271713  ORF Transcript_84244/g.271713 Transcript_84244/m.271713 type:complete len:286 (+) Transcript_84244:1363-2220(+)